MAKKKGTAAGKVTDERKEHTSRDWKVYNLKLKAGGNLQVWAFGHKKVKVKGDQPGQADKEYHLFFTHVAKHKSPRAEKLHVNRCIGKFVDGQKVDGDPEEKEARALALLVLPPGAGTTLPTPGLDRRHLYGKGTPVQIKAIANPGFRFEKWTVTVGHLKDIADPGAAETTVTLKGSRIITANFVMSRK